MSPQDSTNQSEISVRQAENMVSHNLNRFENAMDHLADKFVQIRRIARRPRERVEQVRTRVRSFVSPMKSYYQQTRGVSERTIHRYPVPAVAIACLGSFLFMRWLGTRRLPKQKVDRQRRSSPLLAYETCI